MCVCVSVCIHTKHLLKDTLHSYTVGFPLNITALLPVMMFHFDQPDEFCVKCAETLSKVLSH